MGRTKMFNNYKIINDDESQFYIINKKKEEFIVKISTEDLYRLIRFNKSWNASWRNDSQSYYVCCNEYLSTSNGKPKYKTHYLHRWIFDYPKNMVIDHINHDTLDNRRLNLRLTEQKKNLRHRGGKNSNNVSGYRNVSYMKRNKKTPYHVQIMINGKNKVVGRFSDIEEAAIFAEKMRKKYYGEFAGEE